jgi:hypothetical protein
MKETSKMFLVTAGGSLKLFSGQVYQRNDVSRCRRGGIVLEKGAPLLWQTRGYLQFVVVKVAFKTSSSGLTEPENYDHSSRMKAIKTSLRSDFEY